MSHDTFTETRTSPFPPATAVGDVPSAEIPCDVVSHRPPGHHVQNAILVFVVGLVFGVTLTQSQAISWYRIQEMFRFGSFHMYGIIGSALAIGLLVTAMIRRRALADLYRVPIELVDKAPGWRRYLFGGLLFGLGWAMAGMCPGPMFVLIGHGMASAGIALAAALLGTFSYGLMRDHLPH
jgi:uncharacterized protein